MLLCNIINNIKLKISRPLTGRTLYMDAAKPAVARA